MTGTDPSRRRVLRVAGATLALGGVAGCAAAPGSTSDGRPAAVGATDAPTESGGGADGGATTATAGDDGNAGGGSGWTETDAVEMNDQLAYAPKRVQVSAGTTVTFENVGSIGHTVTAYGDEIPDGAAYFASGGFDSEQAARDGYTSDQKGNVPAGGSYEHTFEATGTYKYYCIPHELNGMVGFVKVV